MFGFLIGQKVSADLALFKRAYLQVVPAQILTCGKTKECIFFNSIMQNKGSIFWITTILVEVFCISSDLEPSINCVLKTK